MLIIWLTYDNQRLQLGPFSEGNVGYSLQKKKRWSEKAKHLSHEVSNRTVKQT